MTSSMLDETRVCLNPLPSIPEEGRSKKYVKLPVRDPVDQYAAVVLCACVVSVFFVIALAVILCNDPCVLDACNDFNITNGH